MTRVKRSRFNFNNSTRSIFRIRFFILLYGLIDNKFIVLNSANVIFDPDIYIFGVISSRMHNLWVNAVAGRLESRIRYTTGICFNSFPFPNISDSQKNIITNSVFEIIDERETHSEKTIAQLYDPNKMPKQHLSAHMELDFVIEQCYTKKHFKDDDEKLEHLFKLYEEMVRTEKHA